MEKALRYNEGKTRLHLVDPYFVEQVAKVMEIGADKYGKDNWLKGQDYTVVLDSLKRHTAKWEMGHDTDEESGLHHMAHVAANAMFLLRYELENMGETYDDRLYSTPKDDQCGG